MSLGVLIFSVDEKTRHKLWWKSMKKVWNICGYQPNEQAWTMSIIDNKERRPQKTTSIVDLDPLLSATMSSTFNSLQRLHKYSIWGSLVKGWSKEQFCFFCKNTQRSADLHSDAPGYTVRCTVQETTKFMMFLWIF